MRRRPMLLLAAALLTAGCLGSADDAATGADEAAEPAAANRTGTLDGHLVPFQTDGTLPAGTHIEGRTAAPTGTWDRWFELDVEGQVTGANLTVTWEATNPTMERLLIGVGPLEGSEQNPHAGAEAVTTTGASPLTLTLEDVNWTTGAYVVWVWWDPDTEPQASPVDQAFEIEGTLEQRVPAP